MTDVFDPSAWSERRRAEVDALLAEHLPPAAAEDDPGRLIESMRYSLLAPGKRLRPLFGLAAAEAVGVVLTGPIRLATAAVELVHCYSLIHDDLPAMDDDDLRRGRLSNHKAFDEATAILAGDALLTLAFEWIAEAGAGAAHSEIAHTSGDTRALRYLDAAQVLARAAGARGMVRGQARDLGEAAPQTLDALEVLHGEKTAALFRAATEVGAVVAGATSDTRDRLARFGWLYGLAFQHADDRADREHDALAAAARERVTALLGEAVSLLLPLGSAAAPLDGLAHALARTTGVTLAPSYRGAAP